MKTKYYTEFEFETTFNNLVWFPLFLYADNNDEVMDLCNSVIKAIETHNKLKRYKKPIPILSEEYSKFISEKIEQQLNGSLIILEFDVWKFKNIKPDIDLTFEEHFALIEFDGMLTDKTVASTIARHRFPVRLYKKGIDLEFNEFLLLNVVAPE